MRPPIVIRPQDVDLTVALLALLRRDGRLAAERAERWPDEWLGKAIAFLANSWLLYEPARAAAVYGGPEALAPLARSETVEAHVLRGISCWFRKDGAGIDAFRRAAALAPGDPYVAFLHAFAARTFRAPANEQLETRTAFGAHRAHPLFYASTPVLS